MNKFIIPFVAILFVTFELFAVLSSPTVVTKNNQSSFGLDFSLKLNYSNNGMVVICINIPKKGEFFNIRNISLMSVDDKNNLLYIIPLGYIESDTDTEHFYFIRPLMLSEDYLKKSIIVIERGSTSKDIPYHILLKTYPVEKK